MTPAQRRALDTLRRRAERFTPDLRKAFLRSLERVRNASDLTTAADALRSGDVDGALLALFPPDAKATLDSDLNVDAIRVMLQNARQTMTTEVPASFRVSIDGPTDAVMAALDRIAARDIAPIVKGTEDGLRDVLRAGLRKGLNPIAIAKDARFAIGLSAYDISLIESFERQLRGDPSSALGRALRDRRFDASVQRAASDDAATLSEEQVGKMREAYTARLHRWRAETYSRTTTINALRDGQLASWQTAADDNDVPRNRMFKYWICTLDGRERPTHHDMHEQGVPIDEPWLVPGVGAVMTPGDSEYNCRCAQVIRIAPK
jgi:hypothetical protein